MMNLKSSSEHSKITAFHGWSGDKESVTREGVGLLSRLCSESLFLLGPHARKDDTCRGGALGGRGRNFRKKPS